jgi:hypothetical protein
MDTTREEFLCGRYDTFGEAELTIRAKTFGQLVKLAQEAGIARYQGDLYHDAQWIEKYVDGPMEFTFAADQWGTLIGTDTNYDTVADLRHHVWACELIQEKGRWFFRSTKVR